MILRHNHVWLAACLTALSVGLVWACKTEEKLPALGESIAGPVDVATSPSGNYFYALNSDYERKFNQGSLMVIDPNDPAGPRKLLTLPTQRLGRSLDVAQNLLLVSYEAIDPGKPRLVELWDLKDEKSPSRVASWAIECSPLNAVLAPTRNYFAVSCLEGQLYMGHLNKADLGASTLDLVRSYGYARRALYFYEGSAGTKFLAFPTDTDTPDVADFAATDLQSYKVATDSLVDGANEVPDSFENTIEARRRAGAGYPYQMVIYDVSAEEQASSADLATSGKYFRYIDLGTFTKPTQANQELRYIYFTLTDLEGVPGSGEGATDENARNYRSNFWTVRPSLEKSPELFYLSQRGNSYGSPSNNILKVGINAAALNAATPASFAEIFSIERVYGFANDRDSGGRYPGAFAVTKVEGEPMLLINHFRDLINFRSAPFYGITRKFLTQPLAQEQASSYDSSSFETSFYQLAVAKSGKVLTCSYYGRSLFLFDASPRTSMGAQTPIRIE